MVLLTYMTCVRHERSGEEEEAISSRNRINAINITHGYNE